MVNKKSVKKVPVKNIKKHKGGLRSADDPDTESSDEYLSEHSEEEIIEDNENTDDGNTDDENETGDDDDNDNEDQEEKTDSETDSVNETEKEIDADDDLADDENCLYKFASKKDNEIVVDVDDGDYFEDDIEIDTTKYVDDKDRQTKPMMFPFERVRLLAVRARQIALGAKPMIKNISGLDAKDIARKELENRVIPLFIIRTLPNGKKEKWTVKELQQA